ncbi:MAG: tRNA pseudouridine(54/55) synthase Pus10 [Candidatus Aenigmarchaeota archaeon]|nr:tRNA pseudouridine(54/55) synthase Pus10 [Candidatus Aenigmarchaeota archaeon]
MKNINTGKKRSKNECTFAKSEIIELATNILKRGNVCNHCLGRQFAHVSTGMTNKERGAAIRTHLKKKENIKCEVCGDIFRKLDKYADAAAARMKKLEYSTFLVGTILSSELISEEESLWEDVGIEYCESIKSELNRELGKVIYDRVKKEHDPKMPDVTVILNLDKDRIELNVSSLFIRGEYNKFKRGLPQTKWDKYDETLEDVIAAPFMLATGGDGHSLHASGREDIDALCFGGRPFVLEIKNPVKRNIDLKKMAASVKKTGKAEILGLKFADRREVVKVKSMQNDKSYRALVEFAKPVKDIEKLGELNNTVINQRTPHRVEHRRADKVRKRKVLGISWKRINNKSFELLIKGEAGLYIKELVSGDDGRSKPSVSGLLKNPAVVKELDVVKIWK